MNQITSHWWCLSDWEVHDTYVMQLNLDALKFDTKETNNQLIILINSNRTKIYQVRVKQATLTLMELNSNLKFKACVI